MSDKRYRHYKIVHEAQYQKFVVYVRRWIGWVLLSEHRYDLKPNPDAYHHRPLQPGALKDARTAGMNAVTREVVETGKAK